MVAASLPRISRSRPLAAYAPGELRLPSWTFTAWVVFRRDWTTAARPSLPRPLGAEIEARRRARLLRDVVPQDLEVLAA
ncbi:MAG: hypothetical protein GC203_20715 [Phenylobacterium sp.]|uniref:hypothetical protein n=1 Tax=Phenylobacterium sp. TaxID=1871053 RepID=UPI0025CBC2D2|nr:hypothetical protein [Phenylobacterium sp.]MBI1200289.1 hypothetical protein [Phenylobacterium sp.]